MTSTPSPRPPQSNSSDQPLPEGVRGWSWGAFWLNWLWAIFNKTWIGLLALIPGVNLIMMVVLGVKGREWAWQNQRWDSIEEFNRVQKNWSWAGWIVMAACLVIGFAAGYVEDHLGRDGAWSVTTEPSATASSASTGSSENESDISLDEAPQQGANAQALPSVNGDSPYPRPQMRFSAIELLKALKDIGTGDHWKREFTNYLSAPQAFWSECLALESSMAQMHGGENQAQAQAYAINSCETITRTYHQCLHGTPLDDAVLCLQRHISDAEANGE